MAKDWVDFRLVKQVVSMQDVLDHYQINWLRKNGDELRGRCPIHEGEGNRTFHVNVGKGAFKCFSCDAHGNVLDLVAALEKCSIREAALKLRDSFGIGENGQRAKPEALATARQASTAAPGVEGQRIINPALSFQLRVDAEHEYGPSRGLSAETISYFGVGFCRSKGMFSGRYIIPLHNAGGELVGYAGRSIDDCEPRYLFPSREKGFHKSHLVYNLHRVAELGSDTAILVEGFFSVMWLHQAGLPAAVGLLGSELSAEQEGMLCRRFGQVLLLFDGDKAGRAATEDCLHRLGRSVWVKAISLGDGLQPDHLSSEEINQLINPAL